MNANEEPLLAIKIFDHMRRPVFASGGRVTTSLAFLPIVGVISGAKKGLPNGVTSAA